MAIGAVCVIDNGTEIVGMFEVSWIWHDTINGRSFEEWRRDYSGQNPYLTLEPYLHAILDIGLGFQYDVRIHWNESAIVKLKKESRK